MRPFEIQVKIDIAQREADFWRDVLKKKSCKDCKHFPDSVCDLAGGVEPPAEVQKVGCGEWSFDEIPF